MLAKEAYLGLYPECPYEFTLKYSAKFSDYNANVRYTNDRMNFSLSRKWKSVGKDIRIGLLQTLILKITGDKISTLNIDFYNIFLKKVHVAAPKTKIDPVLAESFHRVNEKYFDGMIEQPNLVYGTASVRKLGSYEYGSDTVLISRILAGHPELTDYVIYHELLHKKFKYNVKNGRSFHHTREFRDAEHRFENYQEMESRLKKLIRRKKFFKIF